MTDTAPARRLTDADVDEAASLLSRAFFDYPMLQWVIPDGERRRRALPAFMQASLRSALPRGEVYGVGEPLLGVAIWDPPGGRDTDLDSDDALVLHRQAMAAMGADAEARLERFVAEQHVVRSRERGDADWYLAWLGVDPVAQRSGAGAALLADMLARIDDAGQGAFLETEKAANVPYYERHGFRIIAEAVISGGGPRFWAMRRRAAPASARDSAR